MPKQSGNKNNIEAILPANLSNEAIQAGIFTYVVAVSTRTGGAATHRYVAAALPNYCTRNLMLDASGLNTTDNNGRSTFELSGCICYNGETFSYPNLIATAYGKKPFFMTVAATLINNGKDVKLEFFSWNADGNPAPEVQFYWRCRTQVN